MRSKYFSFLTAGILFSVIGVKGQFIKSRNGECSINQTAFTHINAILQAKKNDNFSLFLSNSLQPCKSSLLVVQKNNLPGKAFFCHLEDVIHNRLNFWVRFRMGTDDRYSN